MRIRDDSGGDDDGNGNSNGKPSRPNSRQNYAHKLRYSDDALMHIIHKQLK